jgi:hypothetical protein
VKVNSRTNHGGLPWAIRFGVAALLLVAGCSNGTAKSGTTTQAPAAPTQSKNSSAPATSGSLQGIVLLTYDDSRTTSGVKLSAYDPASGKMTATRSFPAATKQPLGGTGNLLRQKWNADFSALIAQGPVAPDGSAGAGITDSSGNYKPLTAVTSGGYGSPSVKAPLAFSPVTGRLWYVNGVDAAGNTPLGSVDPQVGPASDRPEATAKRSANFFYGVYGINLGYFAPDGFGPVNGSSSGLFLPGGNELGSIAAGDRLEVQVGKEGTLSSNGPYLPVTTTPNDTTTPNPSIGVPELAVSSNSFVTFNSTPHQLFLCTIGASLVTAVPLLPESNRIIQDVGLDPTGTKLAFLSTAGDVTTLYTVSLTGEHQLTTLGEIQIPPGGVANVLAWN